MLDASALRHHLPRLRRHAYLLTGSRMAADCAVAMAVARLPRDPSRRPQAPSLTAVFRELHAATEQLVCPADDGLPPLHVRLLALPAEQRGLVVLVTVEWVSLDEACAVCDVAPHHGPELLAEGRAALEARYRPGRLSRAL
ncbi:hypothetical protein [Caenispirillum bisanense]|uniref:PhyR sigma2 domain-containing protein n=1 Tax=Caenispirillum bisanense TaxID=414052 RepID=A0A286G8Z7_9PROT|nr:hypothetical protein [Caenispirillum bisanense]SOD92023.1 hypothetical protein SAMN05421508_102226 [Caenispirillum bisanense]